MLAYYFKNMIRIAIVFTLAFCISRESISQVGVNILNPDTSAILHLESINRGFLPPRMTTAQRNAIVQPKPGLQVYNIEDSTLQYYNGDCWVHSWQRNCRDCAIDFRVDDLRDTIDRIFTNTSSTTIQITQLAGTPQPTALFYLPNIPQGMTVSLSNYTINGTGSSVLTVDASIFTPPGTYPIIIQALCGTTINVQVYTVVVEPCYVVNINANQANYNLQSANNLPTSQPICVVANVAGGVVVSGSTGNPSFSTGALHPRSRVGINNDGAIIGRGGNGAFGGNFSNFGSPGGNGSNAIDLSVPTYIINTGEIYGGGGGGGSVGLGVNIPVVNINLGIGAGGGGGSELGTGGAQTIPIPIWADGQAASGGVASIPGQGGNLSVPITIPISVVTVIVTPNANGGDGGGFGQNGTSGNLFVNVVARISIPIVGNVTILNVNLPDPPVSSFPAGGQAGMAIKRNGNAVIGVADGLYQTTRVKGRVGP